MRIVQLPAGAETCNPKTTISSNDTLTEHKLGRPIIECTSITSITLITIIK